MTIKQRLGLNADPVFLIDGTAFIYRGFYANRHLRRSDGYPTNALTLVTRLLLRVMREENPQWLLFAMDGKGKNFRHEIYAEYKANREAMPEDLALQIEPIKRMVGALGIPIHIAKGYEADDCIASAAARMSPERPVVILSGDKDLKQCLGPNVFMWDPAAKEDRVLTMAEFEEETGVPPANWPDVQALIGDTSDHIPGVPGIGPKTASQIFSICPTLEDIEKHLDRLPPKLQEKLVPHLEEMFRWRRLTTLKKDLLPDLSLASLALEPINQQACAEIAKEFELVAIGREIKSFTPQDLPAPSSEIETELQPLPGAPAQASIAKSERDLPVCADKTVAVVWPEGLKQPPLIAVEGENKNFSWAGKSADLCAWLEGARLIVTPALKDVMTAKPSWNALVNKKGATAFMDLGLASYILNPEDNGYSWDRVQARWRDTLSDGSEGQAVFALAIASALTSNLKSNGQWPLFEQIEMPLVPVLAAMEERGFAIDPAAFQSFLKDVYAQASELSQEIYKLAGRKFNIRSSRQLGEILFGQMGLTSGRKTKSGMPSTSQLALEKLEGTHPLVDLVLRFRKLDKMQATYLEPLPRLMDAENRIHSTFNQEATATGRISSSDPNLQNIPVRGPLGARMRACFVPPSGNLLIAADYSQIELRLLAHFSKDATLLQAFKAGEDIHAHTAALIFEKAPDQISADQRRMAKTINFGLLYGMGARKLSQELKISEREATDFIVRYFARLGALKNFYEGVIADARQSGYVTTMSGRRRWLPGITSANGQISAQAQRQAVNAVIQGSAADIIKMAMLAVANDQELANMNARLVLQVHDELLLEAPEANAQKAAQRTAFLMETARPAGTDLIVPMLADWGIGKNWAEAH